MDREEADRLKEIVKIWNHAQCKYALFLMINGVDSIKKAIELADKVGPKCDEAR